MPLRAVIGDLGPQIPGSRSQIANPKGKTQIDLIGVETMALPKRKISKARRDRRRTHWKLSPVPMTTCPQCGKATSPHSACRSCGYYQGRLVVKIKKKEEKKA